GPGSRRWMRAERVAKGEEAGTLEFWNGGMVEDAELDWWIEDSSAVLDSGFSVLDGKWKSEDG
ncbi:MAG: hypothetical protein C5B50_17825, partial [Verrucomicrobia bacterium]